MNSPTETVKNIVLYVLENFDGKDCIVKLSPANMGFVSYSALKFSPDFQTIEKLSRGALQSSTVVVQY